MLSRCYPSIEDDIKSLISEGWIRVIKVNKTSTKNISDSELTKIYFACDKAEKEVEGAQQNLSDVCHEYLARIWNDPDLSIAKMDWEKTLQDKPELLSA